jgi:hypothetical protein
MLYIHISTNKIMTLFPTNTIQMGQMGSTTTNIISSVSPFVFIILGIAIAFWIAEIIIDSVRKKENATDNNSK